MPISSSCCDSRSRRSSNYPRDPRPPNARKRPPVRTTQNRSRLIAQRHAALALANEVPMRQRAALKRGIRDGAVSVRALLQAPTAARGQVHRR